MPTSNSLSNPFSPMFRISTTFLTWSDPSLPPSHPISLWLLLMSLPYALISCTLIASLPGNTSLTSPSHIRSLTQFLVQLTKNFSFNSHHYLEVKRMSMGSCMASSYANLFMLYLGQDFLNSELTYSYSGHIVLPPLLHSLNSSAIAIPSTLPGILPSPILGCWCLHWPWLGLPYVRFSPDMSSFSGLKILSRQIFWIWQNVRVLEQIIVYPYSL